MLLAAYGVSTIGRVWAFAGVLTLVACLATYQVFYYYRYGVKEDWRGATHYLLAHARPGDAVVFGGVARRPFTVYQRMGGITRSPDLPLYDASEFRGEYRRIWLLAREGESDLPSIPNRPLAHTEGFEGVRVSLYATR